MGGVGTALAVFAWAEEEEEVNLGEISDGDNSCCCSLSGGVQGLDKSYREGMHSYWRKILFLVGCQILSQAKIDISHLVVLWVVGPHGC